MGANDETVREIEGMVGRLARLGELLFVHGSIIGPDRVSGVSRDGYGDDEVVALAVVVETSADLGASAVTLLANGHAYSAAVLLRQIIEVEYLTWLFSHDPEAARAWLNTEGGWWPAFSPSSIRKKAAGQFSADDYHYHCELGGHPTPNARDLLSNHSRGGDTSWLWDELGCHLQLLWEKVELAADRMKVSDMLSVVASEHPYGQRMESQNA